ncbi:hypothetical protein ES703_24054 [subsurface metagenome]
MKAIRKVLFFHGDDDSLGLMFKAIFQKEILDDPVLATAGLRLDSVGNGSEGESLQESVYSALRSMGIQEFEHTSKNIWFHPDLVRWADLILVPSLAEEDILCINFREAWSKTLPVECYCGQYNTETRFHPGTKPETEDEYQVAADIFKGLFPYTINKLKDSFCDALVASGVPISGGFAVGEAFIVKQALDMEKFREGSILIIDRPGALLYRELDETTAGNIIKKFGGKTTSAMINEFMAKLEGKPVEETASADEMKGDGFAAFNAVLTKAKALICSRGRHGGEISAKGLKIPCVSSCVGATERIASGQTIVVDAPRGEVYDASLLQNLH